MWWVIGVVTVCMIILAVISDYRLDCLQVDINNINRNNARLQERVDVLEEALGKGHNKIESLPDLDAGYVKVALDSFGAPTQ